MLTTRPQRSMPFLRISASKLLSFYEARMFLNVCVWNSTIYTSTNNKYRSGMWLTNFEKIPSRADENLSESVLQPTTISERGLR
jgi:hypothetical protein